MANRDDFPNSVKLALAKRVGYRCSFPGCEAITVGPGSESATATSSVGTACHITAAAPGGLRFDPIITPRERRSAENGIWLCATHGRAIDTDDARFSVTALRAWKLEAEARARTDLGVPSRAARKSDQMLSQVVELTPLAHVNEPIGDAIERSLAKDSLGTPACEALRDLLIELSKNAFQHGNASRVTLSIEPRRIVLVDDGVAFNPTTLLTNKERGGQKSVEVMHRDHPDFLIGYERHGDLNRMTVTHVTRFVDTPELMPCTLTIEHGHTSVAIGDVERFSGCGAVFVKCPRYLTISDAFLVGEQLRSAFGESCSRVMLVLRDSSQTTLDILQRFLPYARIVRS